jgi:hypothetical protein
MDGDGVEDWFSFQVVSCVAFGCVMVEKWNGHLLIATKCIRYCYLIHKAMYHGCCMPVCIF